MTLRSRAWVILLVVGVFGLDGARSHDGLSICDVDRCECINESTEVKCLQPDLTKTTEDQRIYIPDAATSVHIDGAVGLQTHLDSGLLHDLDNLRNLSLSNNGIDIKRQHFVGLKNLRSFDLTTKSHKAIPAEALQPLEGIESFRNVSRDKGRSLIHFRTNEELSENCADKECYKVCGEPGYLNLPRPLIASINLDKKNPTQFKDQYYHALYFDLKQVSYKYGVHYIWAQYVTASKPIKTVYNPPYIQKIYVVTRQFSFRDDDYVRDRKYPKRSSCRVRLLKTGNGKNWFVVQFVPGLTVLAEEVHLTHRYCQLRPEPFSTSDDYIIKKFLNPMTNMSMEYLRAVTYCAKAKGQGSSRTDSYKMLDWALTIMSWLPQEKTISYYTEAATTRDGLESAVEGSHFVPSLTREVYGRMLDLQYRLAKSYKDEYDKFLGAQNDRKFQRTLMGLMKEEAKSLAGATEVDYENALYALKTSKVAIKNLKKNFEETKPKLESARKKFEAGIVAYGIHETARAVFGVFKAIKGIFTGQVLQSVDGLWGTFERLVKMIRTLDRVIKANAEMMKFVEGQEMTVEDERSYLRDVEKAAVLTTNIVEWRNMVTAVKILLQEGDAGGIIGSRGYRRRLQELAEWGEALSRETIRQTDLLRRYLALEAALQARKRYTDTVDETMISEKKEGVSDSKLMEAASLQMIDMKWIITDTLQSYCKTYFYYQFKTCSPKVMPKLSDTLTELIRKVHKAKVDGLESLALLQPTQPIDINIKVKDKGNCSTDSSDSVDGTDELERIHCPVSDLKESNSLVYTISRNEGALRWMSRVRVTEISVEFVGLRMENPDHSLFVSINSIGTFQDSYKGKTYNFTIAPLKKGFVYKPSNNEISMRAMVHQSQGNYLQEISPFTTWMITIKKDLNEKFDLSDVSEVNIRIKGSGVSRYSFYSQKENRHVVNLES